MTPHPVLSERQLRAYDVLQRGRMAWIAFFVVMTMFVVVFGCFIYAVFYRPDIDLWSKGGIFLLDGVLGWSIRQIVGYLFPHPAASAA
jgi:hypothetical protein